MLRQPPLRLLLLLGVFLQFRGSGAFAEESSGSCDLSGYDPEVRPDPEGTPTDVRIGVFVSDIDKVDNLDQSFRTDFFVAAKWKDPRLGKAVQVAGSTRCRFPRDAVWYPQLVIFNQRSILRQLPDRVSVDREGNVHYVQRILGSLRSPFDLRSFPLDRQTLPITIISIAYGPDEVNLQRDTETPRQGHDFMNAGWIVVEETYDVGTVDTRSDDPLAKNERFMRFDYTIHVKRELGYYIWKVIGPLSFIVLMSYAVFWIDPAMAARQIGLASTSILTLVAFLFSLNAILPPLSYMTRMDAFLFASLALSFLAFAEAVVTAVLTSSERRSLALTMDRWARWLFPGTYALFHIFIWTWS